jgi:hypothetical protein
MVGAMRVKAIEHTIYRIKEILIVNLTLNSSPLLQAVNSATTVNSTEATADPSLILFTDGMICGSINNNDQIRAPSPPGETTTDLAVFTKSPGNVTSPNTNANKFEKKIIDEVVKLFQENSGSFYFAPTYDLTNSVERQQEQIELAKSSEKPKETSFWRKCDDRFFWNKVLLGDLINLLENEAESKERFILPLIQGFVEMDTFENRAESGHTRFSLNLLEHGDIKVRICLISRRNRYRLGTRFRRRGIDDNGNVANFVETEQILDINQAHTLSYVIVRGSIPIYWSQPGIKYRPAPRIDRSRKKTLSIFNKTCLNLV